MNKDKIKKVIFGEDNDLCDGSLIQNHILNKFDLPYGDCSPSETLELDKIAEDLSNWLSRFIQNNKGVQKCAIRTLVSNLHSDINDLYLAMDGGKCSDDDVLRSLSGISKYLDEQLDEI